jgi:hypothetical protein
MSEIVIFSVATNLQHHGVQNLIQSANLLNEKIDFLGVDEKWGGWMWRVQTYLNAIKNLQNPENKIVVCIDAYDVLMTNKSKQLITLFKSKNIDLLISSDGWCGKNNRELNKFHTIRNKKSKFPYVCMGVIAGKPYKLIEMYTEILKLNIKDDQLALIDYVENHASEWPLIELDDQEELSRTVTGARHFDFFTIDRNPIFTHFPSFVTWSGFSLAYPRYLKSFTTHGKNYPFLGKFHFLVYILYAFSFACTVLWCIRRFKKP